MAERTAREASTDAIASQSSTEQDEPIAHASFSSAGAIPPVGSAAARASTNATASDLAFGESSANVDSDRYDGHFDRTRYKSHYKGGEYHKHESMRLPDVHHHIMVKTKGNIVIRDAYGHPILDHRTAKPDQQQSGSAVHYSGKLAILTTNPAIGHGPDALYYFWGHLCDPEVRGVSGYVRAKDLEHQPEKPRDTKHVGLHAPMTKEHYVVSPVAITDEAFSFKARETQGNFADYAGGGRSNASSVGGAAAGADKWNLQMTWNLPDKHAGRGGGTARGLLREGDVVTRCAVEPRWLDSVHPEQPGWTKWFYVHAKLGGKQDAYGWVMAEFEMGGKVYRQLTTTDQGMRTTDDDATATAAPQTTTDPNTTTQTP